MRSTPKENLMALTSFNIDQKMQNTLEELKRHYGATSNAEVLRKAIALLQVIKENESEDGAFVLRKNNQDIKVIIR